jgi:DNA-binding NarL/FixJ family response regulator
MTRVAIVEDHPIVRQGLQSVIEKAPDLELTGAVGSIEDFPTYADAQQPQVVLLDLHLQGQSGHGLSGPAGIKHMTERGYPVLVLTVSRNMEDIEDAIEAGARGYLTKDADLEEIVRAIQIVALGGSYVPPALAAHLIRKNRERPHEVEALSAREEEILVLVAQGETDQDIAERLILSIRTVRTHLDRIRDKTGRRRRADLTRLAYEQGLLKDSDRADQPGGSRRD